MKCASPRTVTGRANPAQVSQSEQGGARPTKGDLCGASEQQLAVDAECLRELLNRVNRDRRLGGLNTADISLAHTRAVRQILLGPLACVTFIPHIHCEPLSKADFARPDHARRLGSGPWTVHDL